MHVVRLARHANENFASRGSSTGERQVRRQCDLHPLRITDNVTVGDYSKQNKEGQAFVENFEQ